MKNVCFIPVRLPRIYLPAMMPRPLGALNPRTIQVHMESISPPVFKIPT